MLSLLKLTSFAATAFALSVGVQAQQTGPGGQILPVTKGDAYCQSFIASCFNICKGLGLSRHQTYTCYTVPKTGKHVNKCTCGDKDETATAIAGMGKSQTFTVTATVSRTVQSLAAEVTSTSTHISTTYVPTGITTTLGLDRRSLIPRAPKKGKTTKKPVIRTSLPKPGKPGKKTTKKPTATRKPTKRPVSTKKPIKTSVPVVGKATTVSSTSTIIVTQAVPGPTTVVTVEGPRATVQTGNLLVNGDFEDFVDCHRGRCRRRRDLTKRIGSEIPGWDYTSDPFVPPSGTPMYPQAGDQNVQIASPFDQNQLVYQILNLEEGSTYVYGCWMTSDSGNAYVELSNGNADDDVKPLASSSLLIYKPVFKEFTVTTTGRYKFQFGWNALASGTTYRGYADSCAVAQVGSSA